MQETEEGWIQRGQRLIDMEVQVHTPNTWEIETRRSEVQIQAWLHSQVQSQPGLMRFISK